MSFYSIFVSHALCNLLYQHSLATMAIVAIAGVLCKCYKQVNMPKEVGDPSIMYTASLNSSAISETFFCASMVSDMENIIFSVAYPTRYPLTATHRSAHGLVHPLSGPCTVL